MKIRALFVNIKRPGGMWEAVNVSSVPDLTTPEKLSLIGLISFGRNFSGPFGHQVSQPQKIAVLSRTAQPIPLDTLTTVTVSFPSGPGSVGVTGLYAWVERDVVTRAAPRGGIELYRHDLDLVDALGVASTIPVTEFPAQTVVARIAAINAIPEVSASGLTFSGLLPTRVGTTPLAASTATDALSAYRNVADSIGYRIATNVNGTPALYPHGVALSPSPNWWQPAAAPPSVFTVTTMTGKQLQDVPVALSRLSHVSSVEIRRQVAGDTTTDTVADGRRYGTLQLETQITLATTGDTCLALEDLRDFAAAVTQAPVDPAPTAPMRVLTTDSVEPVGSILYSLLSYPPTRVVRSDAGKGLPAFFLSGGYSITVDPELDTALMLTLQPASLYGLVTIRPSHIAAARFTAAYTPADDLYLSSPVRYHHLATNRPLP